MDFLKNLKLDDGPSSGKPGNTSQHGDRGLFDTFSGVLAGSGNHTSPQTQQANAQPSKPSHGAGGLLGMMGNAVAEYQNQSSRPPSSPAPKHESFLGKIGGVLNGEGHAAAPPPSPPTPNKHEGLMGKVNSVLGGEHHTQQPTGKPGEGGLVGKLTGVLSGSHHSQEPEKPQGLSGKINHALGGGAAGEKKEDALDKAIDFVQEHVLGAGPQKNESAFEQAKDKQIANMIRDQFQKATGKEFPIGAKK